MGRPEGKFSINVNDVIGKRLGKLEVLQYAGHQYEQTTGGLRVRHKYICLCECGEIKTLRRGQLKNEIVHSCGCLKRKRR